MHANVCYVFQIDDWNAIINNNGDKSSLLQRGIELLKKNFGQDEQERPDMTWNILFT